MGRKEMLVWVVAMTAAALAVAWLIERRHVLTLREELDRWGVQQTTAIKETTE